MSFQKFQYQLRLHVLAFKHISSYALQRNNDTNIKFLSFMEKETNGDLEECGMLMLVNSKL